MEQNPQQITRWGLMSPDGFFQPLSALNSTNLEFACKSVAQLHEMLQENVELEKYERCAIIRDELIKRQNNPVAKS